MSTTVNASSPNKPRPAGMPSLVAPGSPLALVGLILVCVRARFGSENADGLPWVWTEDLTPQLRAGSTIEIDPSGQRPLLIESAFNEDLAIKNYRPAIFVDKGPTAFSHLYLDNLAGKHLPTATKGYGSLATIPITITCIAGKRFESAHIAEIVQYFFWGSRNDIRATFGLNELTAPTLSATRPATSDTEVWETSVTFQIQIDVKALEIPINETLLNGIGLTLTDNDLNLEEFLISVLG